EAVQVSEKALSRPPQDLSRSVTSTVGSKGLFVFASNLRMPDESAKAIDSVNRNPVGGEAMLISASDFRLLNGINTPGVLTPLAGTTGLAALGATLGAADAMVVRQEIRAKRERVMWHVSPARDGPTYGGG